MLLLQVNLHSLVKLRFQLGSMIDLHLPLENSSDFRGAQLLDFLLRAKSMFVGKNLFRRYGISFPKENKEIDFFLHEVSFLPVFETC